MREAGRTTVLIIGAGINGISLFRDLALQGVDAVIVDRGDFAGGASSASSHWKPAGEVSPAHVDGVHDATEFSATSRSRTPRCGAW